MITKTFKTVTAACLLLALATLLASSCEKPEKPKGLEVQNNPQRPGDTTVVVTPSDSILPPYMEKWIWVQYSRDDGCWPITITYPPPEDLFGADARAITIDWRDSTYVSQSCKSADTYQIVPEISGRFSIRDTIVMSLGSPYSKTKIVFSDGVTMGPVEIKEWLIRFSQDHDGQEGWAHAYIQQYILPYDKFVRLSTNSYRDKSSFSLFFIRMTSNTKSF
ncbi:MAG: hypothetical protein LBL18_04245 [Bacteroidales bacterium]|jgi:hypothetical protein|nr:hypothetical protein [Bacteroidales bacterium]